MTKVYPVGRGREYSRQVCRGPCTSPASPSSASLTWHCQSPTSLMYCLLIPGEGRGKGGGQVILVQPAVFRWPTTVADGGHQGHGESCVVPSLSLDSHSTKCLDIAVIRPSSPEASRSGRQNTDVLGLVYSWFGNAQSAFEN